MEHGLRRTKAPRDENFPVASLVLSRAHRGAVLAFYRFVRHADDIADSPSLTPSEKLDRLDRLETALTTGKPGIAEALRLRDVEATHGTGIGEACEMLGAFRQDVTKQRYADWAELLDYCRLSANPVGRFLLKLHGERDDAQAPADALCTALQLLNHLQDCATDRTDLNRIYLPVPWLAEAGGEEDFFAPTQAVLRRKTLDAALDRIDHLMDRAELLPQRLGDRRLRAQSIATITLAKRLHRRLRRHDPVYTPVVVSKVDALAAFYRSLGDLVVPSHRPDQYLTAAAVKRSGSSFRLGMQSLTNERRRAIYAVYAFCRAVDDIADGAAPSTEKMRFLNEWRQEINNLPRLPVTPIGRELARALVLFELPLDEFRALLDGMATDSADRLRFSHDHDLGLYSRRVAGSVGVLSIRIFGAPRAHDFALDLGQTLQLVNILRDVDEDAEKERVYVPLGRLAEWGLFDGPAAAVVRDPRFARVCEMMAGEARAGFLRADEALAHLDRNALKPAILMMENYRRILDRLIARGWRERDGKLRLTAGDRIQLFGRAMRPA